MNPSQVNPPFMYVGAPGTAVQVTPSGEVNALPGSVAQAMKMSGPAHQASQDQVLPDVPTGWIVQVIPSGEVAAVYPLGPKFPTATNKLPFQAMASTRSVEVNPLPLGKFHVTPSDEYMIGGPVTAPNPRPPTTKRPAPSEMHSACGKDALSAGVGLLRPGVEVGRRVDGEVTHVSRAGRRPDHDPSSTWTTRSEFPVPIDVVWTVMRSV